MQMLGNLRLLIQPRKQIYTYLKKTCNVNFLIMVCSQKPNTIRNINKKILNLLNVSNKNSRTVTIYVVLVPLLLTLIRHLPHRDSRK